MIIMLLVLFALSLLTPSLQLGQMAFTPGQNGGNPHAAHSMIDARNYMDWRMHLGGALGSPARSSPQSPFSLLMKYKPELENLSIHQGIPGAYPTGHSLASPPRSIASFHNLHGVPTSAQSLLQANRYSLLSRLAQDSFDHLPVGRPELSDPSTKPSASSQQNFKFTLPKPSTANPKSNPKDQSSSKSDSSIQQFSLAAPNKEPGLSQPHNTPSPGNIQNVLDVQSPNLQNIPQQGILQAQRGLLQQYLEELQGKVAPSAAARAQGPVSTFGGVGNPNLSGVPVISGNPNNFLVPKAQTPTTERPVFGGVSNDVSAGVALTLGGVVPSRDEGNFVSINPHSPLSGGFLGGGQNNVNQEPMFDGDPNSPPSQFLTASQSNTLSSSPSDVPMIHQVLGGQESDLLWNRILQAIRSGETIDPQLSDFLIDLAQYSILQTNPELVKRLLADSLQGTGSQTSPGGHLFGSADPPTRLAGLSTGLDGLPIGPAGLPTGSAGLPFGSTGQPTGLGSLPIGSTGLSTDLANLLSSAGVSPIGSTGLLTGSTRLPTGFSNLPSGSAGLPTNTAHLPFNSAGLPTGSAHLSTYQSALTQSDRLKRQQQLQLLQHQQQNQNFGSLLLPTPSALQPGNVSPFLPDQPYIPANSDPQSAANRPYQDPTVSILGGPSSAGLTSLAVSPQTATISPRPATVSYTNVQDCLKNTWCAFALATFVALGTTSALAIPFLAPVFAAAGRRKRQADYLVLDQESARTFATNYMRYINGEPVDLSPTEEYIFHAVEDPGDNEVKEMFSHIQSFIIGNKDRLLNITIHEIEQVQHHRIPDDVIETIQSRSSAMVNTTDEDPPTEWSPTGEEKGPLATLPPPPPDDTLPDPAAAEGVGDGQAEPVTESTSSTQTPAPLLINARNLSSNEENLTSSLSTPLPVTASPLTYWPTRPSAVGLSMNTQEAQDSQVRLLLIKLLQEKIQESLRRNAQVQVPMYSTVNQRHYNNNPYNHNRRTGFTHTHPRLSEYLHRYLTGYNSENSPQYTHHYNSKSRTTNNLTTPGRRYPVIPGHSNLPTQSGYYSRPGHNSQTYSNYQGHNSQPERNSTLDDNNLITGSGVVFTPFANARVSSQFTPETVEFYRAVCTVVSEGSVPLNEIIQFIGEKCSLLQYAGIL